MGGPQGGVEGERAYRYDHILLYMHKTLKSKAKLTKQRQYVFTCSELKIKVREDRGMSFLGNSFKSSDLSMKSL